MSCVPRVIAAALAACVLLPGAASADLFVERLLAASQQRPAGCPPRHVASLPCQEALAYSFPVWRAYRTPGTDCDHYRVVSPVGAQPASGTYRLIRGCR